MMHSSFTAGPSTPAATGAPESPGKALRNWSSLIGIITAIVGNILIALALNVQRYAHTRLNKERVRVRQRARAALKRSQSSGTQSGSYGAIGGHADDGDDETLPLAASQHSSANTDGDDDDDDEQAKVASTYLKSPYWWLGQILITLGEMGNFLAYGFAPASIVSPLGVVALVSNCIIAPAMFHEKFRGRDFWGVVIAVAGVVTVVLSANQEETKLEPHDVWEAITTMEFEIYLGVTTLLILILMWASGRYGKRTILIDLGLVGLFGGYTALATKGVSSMLSSTLWRAFTTPVTYVLILILLVTAVMQIRYVNKALQRFDSTQVIPIQFVLFTLCVILGSAILYRDFEKTTGEQAVKFVGGCLLTFFGVFLITTGRQPQEDPDDLLSDEEGVEETIGLTQQEANSLSRVPDLPTPPSQSRRSSRLSRVSFAEATKPGSPPDDADIPSLGPLGAAGSPTDLLEGESSPLLGNPWRESYVDSAPAPRGTRTLSADSAMMVPALASTSANSVPPTPTRGLTHPHTDRPVTPRTSSCASRTSSRRRSKTFISPSPLSSTVTTVVKDAFLGGHDIALGKRTSLKRIRSSIRASLFFHDEEDKGGHGHDQVAALVSDDHLPRISSAADSDDENPRQRMSRSVSDALGDFFRSRKKKPGAMGDGQGEAASDVETGTR
ncbi:magnesium transporter NIPA domain-containing protein [Hirsutella rhossiliensis]|uniref:Magnesium transporter NIPA domain-containing protein n=1 Tax=Hirsutella rhossiliensis TaxID=111463 RepID=A0A9P8MRY7_9HYPO|nr:magnesium transporter NIPA domain-containing protein [Hirsutella rhossiliensis]KAH0960039.1 magnesium transporter NIPA domain-containing protein [Hirsutella rhossiliensis]